MTDELALAAGTPDPLTDEQRTAFLDYVRKHKTCSVREACEQVGVKRKQIRHLKRVDDEFAGDYREARGYANEQIVAEISRRAIEGWDEPVFHNGEIVGEIRKFDGRLLTLLAKAYVPEFRDVTRLEHTGPGGGPVEVENPDVAAALDRFTTTIGRLAERAAESRGAVRELEPGSPDEAAATPGS